MNNKLNNWTALSNEEMIVIKGGTNGERENEEPEG